MNINERIDHTILRPDATKEDVIKYCQDAIRYGFKSVVVNSYHVPVVAEYLANTSVNTVAVVGFPLGAVMSNVKAFEAKEAVKRGANEIDMVINIGQLKEKNYTAVLEDIQAVVVSSEPAIVKVIIETSELTELEKIIVCELIIKGGAHYVKTSTGFSKQGATIEDIQFIKKAVKDQIKIKASGGIRNIEDARGLIEAGADRLGVGDGKLLIRESI